jgi:trans-aconitate 2-methyltransferase
MPWNPDLYDKFKSERFAPFDDLLCLIHVSEGMRVIDLGCGTGELTSRLANHLPNSEVVGIDSSEEMLSRAEGLSRPGLRFEKQAIEDASGEWDLVFSHAAIQWVDDHAALIPRLLELVRPGGQLAVQLPSNHEHPSHRIIEEIAGEEPFRQILLGWSRRTPVLRVGEYAELLHQNGCDDLVVFEKVYPHVLSGADDLVEWTSSTALVPYFERLGEEGREEFLRQYRTRLNALWPVGPVFYGFQRILFSAMRRRKGDG